MKKRLLPPLTAIMVTILLSALIMLSVSGASTVDNFEDVPKNEWYYDEVSYVVEKGIMNGKSESRFEPETPMTRAELVTVLWRTEGSPVTVYQDKFGDVPTGQFYTSAVLWAFKNGIVNGTSDNEFSPEGFVTRQQIATIFHRFADLKGIDVASDASLGSFIDSGRVDSYAVSPLKWATAVGLITGIPSENGTYLDPTGNATRAQVAAILQRFLENIMPGDSVVDPGEAPENAPVIFHTGNTVALPGDIVTVSGEYLDCFTSVRVEGQTVRMIQAGRQSFKFEIPTGLEEGAYECELRGPGITEKIVINKPVQVWTQGDEGEIATPGGWIRVNGECLSIDGEDVTLELTGAGSYTVPASDVKDAYSVEFALPEDIAHGEYTARFYNGHAVSDSFTVTVAASPRDSWPTTVFNILDYGAVQSFHDYDEATAHDNSNALKDALTAAKENGGGVIYFPRGSYYMSRGAFSIPENTVLRGEGMNLVRLYWGNSTGSGWDIGDVPATIFSARNGNIAIEEMTFQGALMPTFLQAGLKPKYNEGGNNVYITNCRIQSNMYAKNNGFWEAGKTYTEEELTEFTSVNRMMFDAKVQNFQVTGCELEWDFEIMGANDQFKLGYYRNVLFRNNEVLRSGFHYRADGVIFEDNELHGSSEGNFIYGINGEKTYFARNYLIEGADSGDRESMSSDWNRATDYLGQITFTDDTHVIFPEESGIANLSSVASSICRPRIAVMIVDGTGMGSYRYVTERDGNALTLEAPFEVWDETSVFTATRLNSYFYIVNNTIKHSGDLQFYTGQVHGVVDGNVLHDTGGFALYGTNIYDGWQTDWYISFVNNTLSGGTNYMKFGIDGHVKAQITASSNGTGIAMNYANVFRRNRFTDTSFIEIYTPYEENGASGRDIIIEDNYFENSHWGIHFSGSTCFNGTVLTGNEYKNVDIPVGDVTRNPDQMVTVG